MLSEILTAFGEIKYLSRKGAKAQSTIDEMLGDRLAFKREFDWDVSSNDPAQAGTIKNASGNFVAISGDTVVAGGSKCRGGLHFPVGIFSREKFSLAVSEIA